MTADGLTADWVIRLDRELGRPELFDEGVEAARNACVAGASIASAAMTSAAYYDNPLTGTPALRACMRRLAGLALELGAWQQALAPATADEASAVTFTPGFGFVLPDREPAVVAAAERLLEREPAASSSALRFAIEHQRELRRVAGPLNATGLAALTYLDHRLDADVAERLFLIGRIELGLREAQRARRAGVSAIPFGTVRYVYEGALPPRRVRDRAALMRRVGLAP